MSAGAPTRRAASAHQRLAGERGQQRLLRRLPDDRVTADEGQRRVPRPHRDREVEGADDADDAERVPLLHHPVARTLGGDREAEQLARQPDGEVADVDHLLHLAEALGADLAGLDRDQRAEIVLVLAQQLAQLAHETRRAPGPARCATARTPSGARRRSSSTSSRACARRARRARRRSIGERRDQVAVGRRADRRRRGGRGSRWTSRGELFSGGQCHGQTVPSSAKRAPALGRAGARSAISSCLMKPVAGSRPSATSSMTATAEAAVVHEIARHVRPLIVSGW